MPDRPQNEESQLISEQAADWFVCLKNGNLSASERQQYVRWLKRSPAHIAEMLELTSLHCHLRNTNLDGIFPSPEEVAREEGSNIIEGVFGQRTPEDQGTPEEMVPEIVQRSVWRRHWKLTASLAALALSLLLGTVAKFVWFDNIIETEASEWRHFTLADGSVARVGPRSRLRLDFDDGQRAVYLSRGEAVFQVVKDPRRPFLVNAEWTVVRAVGTEFGVAHHNDTVVVTVAEGSVDVSQRRRALLPISVRETNHAEEAPSAKSTKKNEAAKQEESAKNEESIAVSAGEQVSVSREWPVTVHRVDSTRELAWAQGKLIFNNDTTLAQAIEQFNRRNRVQIEVDDPELAGTLVCCIFNADDPESFALSVATKQNVELIREGEDRLRLVVTAEPDLI